MTTRVMVDAHAGWPVQVTLLSINSDGEKTGETVRTVEPNTTQDFCVHSHQELHVKELPREKP